MSLRHLPVAAALVLTVVTGAGCGGGSKPAQRPQVGAAMRTAGDARAGGATYVAYDNCTKAALRPTRIVIACGSGAEYLRGAHYSSYGRAAATGSADLVADDCRPDCARGRFVARPARFRLSRPVKCRDGRQYYSRVVANARGTPGSDYPIAPLSC
jgi:hypothetical protein